jgi:hypothetical protein
VLDLYQGQPAEWASTLKNWISALEARLLSGDGCLQGDFPGPGAGASARYAYIQNFVLQFGRALNWWPEIVCAARRLKSNGHRLGRLLTST